MAKFTFAYNVYNTPDLAGAALAARNVRKHYPAEHIKVIIKKVTYFDEYYEEERTDYFVSVYRHRNHTDLPF